MGTRKAPAIGRKCTPTAMAITLGMIRPSPCTTMTTIKAGIKTNSSRNESHMMRR